MDTLKHYVHNKAWPEGSIAKAYVLSECLTFCSMYLRGIETQFNREERNLGIEQNGGLSIFSQKFRPLGAGKYVELTHEKRKMGHWYILNNCEEVDLYVE